MTVELISARIMGMLSRTTRPICSPSAGLESGARNRLHWISFAIRAPSRLYPAGPFSFLPNSIPEFSALDK